MNLIKNFSLFFLFAAVSMSAQPSADLGLQAQPVSKLSERSKQKIDSTYNALVKKYKVVGASIAIVDNGELVYATGYGFADRENKIKASEKTVYRIGSCTKSFTSLSILQLQEKNLLNINKSVKEYLPELTIGSRFNDNNNIYINEMMSHVSGLPCDIMNGFFCDQPPSIKWEIEELNKQTTMSPRRYKHAYSNVAFGLLGEVIARLSNKSYSAYVSENIFKPLGMTSSYIDYNPELATQFSKAYVNNKLIKEPLIRDQAAGLIHSNVLDMGNYLIMYLNKGNFKGTQILSPQNIADMESNHIEDIYLANRQSWGYGLYSSKVIAKKDKDSALVTMIGHGGDTYAFHADFGFIPELNVGVVVLTNTDRGTSINSAARLLKLYLKETTGKSLNFDYKEPENDMTIANKGLNCSAAEKVGTYNFGDFVMKVKNTKVIKFRQGPAKITLRQKTSDTNNYTVKAVIFGIIPIKIRGQEFKFVSKDNQVYAKAVYTKRNTEDFIGRKSTLLPIPATWKAAYGNYKAIEKIYTCTNCPFTNAEGMSLSLKEKGGIMLIKTHAKTPDMNGVTYLEMVSDKLAVTGGIERGTGETVRLLDNGNIYYSGFEFKKVK